MQTRVLIIGGGVTGAGIARDLSMRGVDCVLIEKGEINSGASGANHGLLHSGARYVSNDPESAAHCSRESALLKRLAPHLINDCAGFFASVSGDDPEYAESFQELCAEAEIPCMEIGVLQARMQEPALSPELKRIFEVPDAAVDPYRLTLETIRDAEARGARILTRTELESLDARGGRIRTASLKPQDRGGLIEVEAEIFVNAAGAWAPGIARMAGAKLDMLLAKGTLTVFREKITNRVINRLRRPGDADILVPGRGVSILGTTSVEVDDPDGVQPTAKEIEAMLKDASRLIPNLGRARILGSYAGVRPLADAGDSADDRRAGRGFEIIDHSEDGIANLFSVTGGKLTLFRLMAERASDRICSVLGVNAACLTSRERYPSTAKEKWSLPPFRDNSFKLKA